MYVCSEAPLRPGVKEPAHETKSLLRMRSDSRTEGFLIHLKIVSSGSSPQQLPMIILQLELYTKNVEQFLSLDNITAPQTVFFHLDHCVSCSRPMLGFLTKKMRILSHFAWSLKKTYESRAVW